jgi:hypothetical protein
MVAKSVAFTSEHIFWNPQVRTNIYFDHCINTGLKLISSNLIVQIDNKLVATWAIVMKSSINDTAAQISYLRQVNSV